MVTFGAFVEIMDGVEGLVHISELAHHHVENPREIVEPGQDVRVKILEIDSERRRLSLSVKRVEEQLAHIKSAAAAGAAAAEANAGEIGDVPDLGLSEDVFAGPQTAASDDCAPPADRTGARGSAPLPGGRGQPLRPRPPRQSRCRPEARPPRPTPEAEPPPRPRLRREPAAEQPAAAGRGARRRRGGEPAEDTGAELPPTKPSRGVTSREGRSPSWG